MGKLLKWVPAVNSLILIMGLFLIGFGAIGPKAIYDKYDQEIEASEAKISTLNLEAMTYKSVADSLKVENEFLRTSSISEAQYRKKLRLNYEKIVSGFRDADSGLLDSILTAIQHNTPDLQDK